jgi:hypothetical protein
MAPGDFVDGHVLESCVNADGRPTMLVKIRHWRVLRCYPRRHAAARPGARGSECGSVAAGPAAGTATPPGASPAHLVTTEAFDGEDEDRALSRVHYRAE